MDDSGTPMIRPDEPIGIAARLGMEGKSYGALLQPHAGKLDAVFEPGRVLEKIRAEPEAQRAHAAEVGLRARRRLRAVHPMPEQAKRGERNRRFVKRFTCSAKAFRFWD